MRIVFLIVICFVFIKCDNNSYCLSDFLYYHDINFDTDLKITKLNHRQNSYILAIDNVRQGLGVKDTVFYVFNSDINNTILNLKTVKFVNSNGSMNTKFPYVLDWKKEKYLSLLKPIIPATTSYKGSKTYKIDSKDYIIDKFYLDEQDSLYFYKTYYLENFGFLCYFGVYENYTYVIRDFKNPYYTKEEIGFLVDTLFRDSTFFEYYREIVRITR